MAEYCNARFRSKFNQKYKVPKSASEQMPVNRPFVEQSVGVILPKDRKERIRLGYKTMNPVQQKIVAKVYDKIANTTDVATLGRANTCYGNEATPIEARIVTQMNMRSEGTVVSTNKSAPIIEKVGQMYLHPVTKVDETLMKQEALRNVASLPNILKKLQARLSLSPSLFYPPAIDAGKPAPPPAPSYSASLASPEFSTPSSSPIGERKVKGKAPQSVHEADSDYDPQSDTSSSYADERKPSISKAEKVAVKVQLLIEYLDDVKQLIDQNSDGDVDQMIIEDMNQKGFKTGTTRSSKSHRAVHKYIVTKRKQLQQKLEEASVQNI